MTSSLKTISRPEWMYKAESGAYKFILSIIEEDILHAESIGFSHRIDIISAEKIIEKVLDEFFPDNAPVYFIADLSKTTGSTTGARNEHLNHRLEQLERTALIVYSNPNTIFKIIIKASSLFSPKLHEKVILSKDFNHAVSIIKHHKQKVKSRSEKPCSLEELKLSMESNESENCDNMLSSLPDDKDTLKKLVIKLKNETIDQKRKIKEKSDQLVKLMGKITWGNLLRTEPIEIIEQDDFSDLFTAFNLLQIDLVELIKGQKKSQDELLKKERQYRVLFNNIADIVLLHDMETHKFVDCNKRALKYGYTKAEILTMTPFDLHPASELKRVKKSINNKNKAPGDGGRYQHIMKDGTLVDVEIRSSRIEFNGRPTWLSIVRDITHRRLFEDAIIKKQKEAEAASQAKSDFLANMSHEIRTPMNGVVGMLDLLLETNLSASQYEFAVSAQQSADSLLILINDILDFSKIEARKLEIEIIDFDLSVTMDSLGDLLSIMAQEKGIGFALLIENKVPLLLRGDPSRLRQILSNLAGNALKFTSKGEIFIKVSLEKETEKSAALLFEVIDTGVGIPEDKLDILFESFTQVDSSTTREYGGTGLGLAISRQLTELMGGKINVKSKINKGSNFYFTIVFEKQTSIKQSIVLAHEIKGTKILIVDGSNTNHQIFKEYLKSWDCSFHGARDGKSAVSMLKKASEKGRAFKLVLIDMNLADMSGKELGRTIKDHKDIQDTIMIMLSSHAHRGDVKKLHSTGFAGYLTKPIKKSKLFDILRTVLSIDSQTQDKPEDPVITSYKVEEIKKAQEQTNPRLNILLVEDNKVNQFVAKKMLTQMTKKITIANNGKEAVELFSKMHFDIIFMDIQMPVMDGTEAIEKIRGLEKKNGGHIPIIALTANAMKGDRKRFLASGADNYLSKPLKKELLIKTVKSLAINWSQRPE